LQDLNPQKSEVEQLLAVPVSFFYQTAPRREKIQITNIPAPYMKTRNIPTKYHKPWEGVARDVFFWEYAGEVIWGLTAEIIYDFMKRMRKQLEEIK
jgi:hypothetical protein